MEQDNRVWITEFLPTHLHTCLMQLYPRRCDVPQSLGSSLLQTPNEKWVLPSEKKKKKKKKVLRYIYLPETLLWDT